MLIQTGVFPEEGWGDEDAACADVIESGLTGKGVDLAQIAERVRASRSGRHFDGTRPDFPPSDLEMALQVDRFNFVLQVRRDGGLHAMERVNLV